MSSRGERVAIVISTVAAAISAVAAGAAAYYAAQESAAIREAGQPYLSLSDATLRPPTNSSSSSFQWKMTNVGNRAAIDVAHVLVAIEPTNGTITLVEREAIANDLASQAGIAVESFRDRLTFDGRPIWLAMHVAYTDYQTDQRRAQEAYFTWHGAQDGVWDSRVYNAAGWQRDQVEAIVASAGGWTFLSTPPSDK